ncbi:MAG TPA: acyloxyacyl hydrolase [Candidatus Acidoferrales bacterium]|nr:acyloxyacyl hydrolase [Candidatus Acidoferrales bacterium]
MKFCFFAVMLFSIAAASNAQSLPEQSLSRGAWELQPFIGGGTGLGHADTTQFLIAGGRVGKIITGDHLHGWARGNFEFAADFMPLYLVMQPGGAVYGASFKPVIFQWNFTSGKKIDPYALIAGGILFTTSNVPPGNTSYVNFTSQGALGFRFFKRPKRSWNFEIQAVHHSNASLGHLNPGLNASLLFTLGYSWFK